MFQNKKLVALALLILLALIWGSSFILIKKGLIGLEPEEVGSLRIASAFLVLLPVALKRIARVKREEWKFLISVGFAGSLIPSFLFAVAQTNMPSGVTGILNALTPLFTILIASLVYKNDFPKSAYLGVLIGFLGSVLLIYASAGQGFSGFNIYAMLIILATVMYATNLNIIKNHLQTQRALTITSISLACVGPISLYYLLVHTPFLYHLETVNEAWVSTLYIILLGVLGTAIALIIFNYVVSISSPLFTSSVTYLIPLVAVGWGILDGERIQYLHLIGMVLIIVGVYVANRRKQVKKQKV